ncbi:PH, RCC1 and FYVE domains-containing protein 1-like [Olea europaea var. sylvestris]|uniref:PH, RCC1 and FYVE domains-containing protein 1-like n=1 Tax=Olea europaea var. sylvestris TaxID=158386 RepID=UPI000C1D5985|nr:PH, RCC1 and FYVE domains-containing protein 1-like [Olea europaea var. sylvestris]
MADPASYGNPEQALIALKKGTQLIKYSRKGKPKFCPFRLSPDETTLIWYSHAAERNLKLSSVSKLIPGQRTAVFRRYLCSEKEYLSFSLIYNNGERSLDLICKDKAEAEVWIAGLKALISSRHAHDRHTGSDISDIHAGSDFTQDIRPFGAALEFSTSIAHSRVFTDSNSSGSSYAVRNSDVGSECTNMQVRTSGADGFRISVSSTPSCSSQGSGPDDIESLGDVYVWGEIWSDKVSTYGSGDPIPIKNDALIPKPLETNTVLDVQQIACGVRHVSLVTRQGEVFTWGEESGGRLGHGIEKDFSHPRLVEFLATMNVDFVACGEFHTCAVSASGDLYSWGDGTHSAGLLGHGNDVSHWIPKRVSGPLEGIQVFSVACGTWHSALTTSTGKLFTFGDGTFGALGHGDRESILYPKEVQSVSEMKTVAVACGVWHTAAIIEVRSHSSSNVLPRKIFTWGDGDKYRLGHGNKETYLIPTCVSSLIDYNIHQLACGLNMTVALTTSGHVFVTGSNAYGELGNPQSDGKSPCLVQDRLVGEFVEQIACGAHHVTVLTSGSEVFTWGRGANGRLGHGDSEDRNTPTLVEALKDRNVRTIACGSNYTASICIHKWVSGVDQSVCTSCRQAFGFTRKRHNCYNCGLVHCHACSSKKALRAALAPTPGKPHRVCDSCYLKMKKAAESGSALTFSRKVSTLPRKIDSRIERGEGQTSRLLLSPTTEPLKSFEIKSGKPGMKSDSSSTVRASEVQSLLQLRDVAFPSSLSALQYALKPVVTAPPQSQQPQPQLQSNSRPASSYSRRPSPPRSVTPVFSRGFIDSLNKTNELLNQEVSKLQSQVKSLKQKSEVQDTEIQKLKKNADEAVSLAAARSSNCTLAMQAVNSFTAQLKENTKMLPPELTESESFKSMNAQFESFKDIIGTSASEVSSTLPPELMHGKHNQANKIALASGSNYKGNNGMDDRVGTAGVQDISQHIDGTPPPNNGSSVTGTNGVHQSSSEVGSGTPKAVRGQKEIIEQFEPGVYVTLIQLENGTKIFKRVRFSKRRFAEQQAEEWWKENKDRLLMKYSSSKTNGASEEETTRPPAEENNEVAQSS